MKSIKLIPLLALLFFISCNDAEKEADDMDDMAEEADMVKPEDANKDWIAAWNNNDAPTLDSLTAKDATVYMQGQMMESDSVSSWYKMSAPQMKGLETTSSTSYSNGDIAYDAGTYRHQIKSDSTGSTYEGTYTLIWKKAEKDWKLQVINIADKAADTTATEMPEEQE